MKLFDSEFVLFFYVRARFNTYLIFAVERNVKLFNRLSAMCTLNNLC